ncbi:MAG: HD domain-containing protein [Anaerolineales bacterium]|nr:HD domain-containing protein [Anaerolineales bacterium]
MLRKPIVLTGKQRLYYSLLVVLAAALAWVALMLPLRSQLRPATLQAGQVAGEDYLAQRSLTYTSRSLTELRREEAADNVQPIFTPPDTTIARRQSERLRAALAYISSVRADGYASEEEKLTDLSALDDLELDQDTIADLLALSDARWQAVGQESIVTLESVMSSSIRPEVLKDALARVPSLVSLSLSISEANTAGKLAAGFVAPNSFFSEELTEAARQAARQAVEPVMRTYGAGQIVVRRGQVLNETDIEALQQLGLITPPLRWEELVSAVAVVFLMVLYILLYFRRDPTLLGKPRRLTLIAFLFLVFLFTARLLIPYHTVIPYAFPLAAYSLTVVALYGALFAMVTSLPLAVLTAFGLGNALDLTLYYLAASLLGILALGKARRMASFLWAGAAVALAGALVVFAFRLTLPTSDWVGVATLSGVSIFNGLATASLTILLQFFLAQLLGTTTPMHLMDLTRPDHPLLQKILRQAAGTYQHSLQVANLAEQAAERIGAEPLLTRVGALYHDAGKLTNPAFFIENQAPGMENPHLGLSEHHGTTLTRYQYVQAVKAAGGDESKVDQNDFRYPGPRPQSRETAILMLADGCEARVRAERPKEEEDLRAIVKAVIDERVASGQLDDTHLTLQDLTEIVDSFSATLRGVYHPRIIYPQLEQPSISELATRPIAQAGRRMKSEQTNVTPGDTPTLRG